ncbi:uncharacterized protein ASCRUDRAFT_74955 [Ascoidea rubescens DSM 1968]|uniref:Uncharacterized protein n=1 Tax=Ascoidea rubescens DSM 1968 TaxID=1344418 RepID=A0A1D2VLX1_9ASCO|nr:hypothetical protein ASCRUDRAFT_74955 [Ascoidea rubescens DSM 1968]ODV62606.1 hypothetical protein ASCRUDRAFT_74955 [Ascoidea rubescens DSM 1968]
MEIVGIIKCNNYNYYTNYHNHHDTSLIGTVIPNSINRAARLFHSISYKILGDLAM